MTDQIRVLHFAESLQGGVATYLSQIIPSQLDEYGVGSLCLVVHESEIPFLDIGNSQLRIYPFRGSKRSLSALLSASVAFYKAVSVFRPHVIHLHSSFAGLIGRILPRRNAKVVYCAHGWAFLREHTTGVLHHVVLMVERLMAFRAHAIVNISSFEAEQASLRRVGVGRSVTIVNGILPIESCDVSGFMPDLYPADCINVLFVGRFDRQKGFDVALDTFRLISASKFRLIAIGDYVVSEKNESEIPSNVTLLGWLSRGLVSKHMAKADLVFMPSRWEGFGLVAIESMCMATPVLASSVGALPEVVEHGYSGVISHRLVPDAFAELIRSLTKEVLEQLGRGARESFERSFTAEKMNRSLVALYEDLLADRVSMTL